MDIMKIVANASDYDTSIAAVIAVIGALIALLQVKANIISTARIDWANNLRNEIAEVVSNSINLVHLAEHFRYPFEKNGCETISNDEIWKWTKTEEVCDLMVKISKSCHKLLLHLNPNNKRNSDQILFETLVLNWLRDLQAGKIIKKETMTAKDIETLLSEGRVVIKKAWDDAKTFKLRELSRLSFR